MRLTLDLRTHIGCKLNDVERHSMQMITNHGTDNYTYVGIPWRYCGSVLCQHILIIKIESNFPGK